MICIIYYIFALQHKKTAYKDEDPFNTNANPVPDGVCLVE